jgi:glycogen synthase
MHICGCEFRPIVWMSTFPKSCTGAAEKDLTDFAATATGILSAVRIMFSGVLNMIDCKCWRSENSKLRIYTATMRTSQ